MLLTYDGTKWPSYSRGEEACITTHNSTKKKPKTLGQMLNFVVPMSNISAHDVLLAPKGPPLHLCLLQHSELFSGLELVPRYTYNIS